LAIDEVLETVAASVTTNPMRFMLSVLVAA